MVISAVAPEVEFGSLMIPLSTRKTEPFVESIRQQYLTGWKMTSELFAEKPDVNMHVDEFDMNTWMDVQVDEKSGTPAIFEDQAFTGSARRSRNRSTEDSRCCILRVSGGNAVCISMVSFVGKRHGNGRDRWMWSLGKRIPEQQRYVFWSRA